MDRFWDRFLEYELSQVIDNKCFYQISFAVWGHHNINKLRITAAGKFPAGFHMGSKNV